MREVIECIFDEKIINLTEILEIFFATHDPTQLNSKATILEPNIDLQFFALTISRKNLLRIS